MDLPIKSPYLYGKSTSSTGPFSSSQTVNVYQRVDWVDRSFEPCHAVIHMPMLWSVYMCLRIANFCCLHLRKISISVVFFYTSYHLCWMVGVPFFSVTKPEFPTTKCGKNHTFFACLNPSTGRGSPRGPPGGWPSPEWEKMLSWSL